MSGRHKIPSRNASDKSSDSRKRHRLLRAEQLESRELLSGTSLLAGSAGWYSSKAPVAVVKNLAPTVDQALTIGGGTTVTGKTAQISVLGKDDGGETNLIYQWSVSSAPANGKATFNVNGTHDARNAVVMFNKAGTYVLMARIIDKFGLYAITSKSVTVGQTPTSFSNVTSVFSINGTSVSLTVPKVVDQFGVALAAQPALTWSAATMPTGATAPTFSVSGTTMTATFSQAGAYTLKAVATGYPNLAFYAKVTISQKLTSLVMTPTTATLMQGVYQQFSCQALDQFSNAMTVPPAITWTATSGVITSTGLFVGNVLGTSTVTAQGGGLSSSASVTVQLNTNIIVDPALAALTTALFADGSINRADMIQILRCTEADGVVDVIEMADLQTILGQATTWKIPDYVRILANDIVNGNPANANYQGAALGNLYAGSTTAQLEKLIGKWFLGTDHPTLTDVSLSYTTVSGSLFAITPTHVDAVQGTLNDCYFLAALGTLADANQTAVRNMFVDNGDGTFTVRFYSGTYGTITATDGSISAGFLNGLGAADYVTVDLQLPTTGTGTFAYANYGAAFNNTANTLWVALAEKAYAQWCETGKAGRSAVNAYSSIAGGWMATVDAQVLGYNATDYVVATTSQTVAVDAIAAHKAVTIATLTWAGTKFGLTSNHAYEIIGYNASTGRFTLYNPWGGIQPATLTWAQLQGVCTQMVVANTSGTMVISGMASSGISMSVKAGRFENSSALAAMDSAKAFVSRPTALDFTVKAASDLSESRTAIKSDGAQPQTSSDLARTIDDRFAAVDAMLSEEFASSGDSRSDAENNSDWTNFFRDDLRHEASLDNWMSEALLFDNFAELREVGI